MNSIGRHAPTQPDVVICECFGRDGLQHETAILPAAHKAALLDAFAGAGFMRVEATSYSNPAVVPQFADASEVLRQLPRRPGVFYKATCANVRAVERALVDYDAGFGANEISVLVSASESHSLKNLKRSCAEQWQNIAAMVARAGPAFRIIGTISVAFGCPFEGRVEEATVIHAIESFLVRGVNWVTLGDTTGMATPASVASLSARIARHFPEVKLIAHFHDTRGTAMANCVAAYEAGVRYFDASFGGVGGHPAKVRYGGGYTGNVCTEDLVNLFETMGVATGIDLAQLLNLSARCEAALGRALNGRVTRSGLNPLLGAHTQSLGVPGSLDPNPSGIRG
ncbi:hydroxymethylglutaryl-CoA lyase [Pandoraea terrigena]|uniref:Hydroxymethylglutaryl-CoA lyase YngG n=1 Tax=Pandoraea terrigena TaxID=2508292 RepID=A0A5E4UGY8_9BURK|nr:hydroxymethylglutaryl-CoA lyase [Pandoraea terrigena]VVD97449.1 Hydroxymethylglutaryl-CoA lyase YngG [Pandoraea terrigena]